MRKELINRKNTCAVVVWYHPSEREQQAMQFYAKDVAKVIVVDNSEGDNSLLCQDIPHVVYLPQGENKGIAAALNIGCKYAESQGMEWVLTMDQDSRWNQTSVARYMEEAEQYAEVENTAIFSPFQDCDGHPETHHRVGQYEIRDMVMCSGNLLRLSSWKQTGGFREDFFIDLVDDEMCCHLRQGGWLVVRCNEMLLSHTVGNGVQKAAIGRHAYTAHPEWRYYYIGRNMRRMIGLYPAYSKHYSKAFLKELKRLVLYDNNQKWAKISQLLKGWKEGICG